MTPTLTQAQAPRKTRESSGLSQIDGMGLDYRNRLIYLARLIVNFGNPELSTEVTDEKRLISDGGQ